MQLANQIHSTFHDLIKSGQLDAAGWLIKKMLEEYPEHALAHYDRAVLAHDAGDIQTAQHHFERAAELAPDNFTIQIDLAHFYHAVLGQAEKALNQYIRSLSLKPQDIGALIIAGHLCVGMRDFDQARQFYQKVLSIEPWHSDARESLEKLDRCMPQEPAAQSADTLYHRGLGKAQAGDINGAITDLELVLDNEPQHALAHNDLGVLYYEKGAADRALEHYERAVALAPHNAVFQKNIGDFHYVERKDVRSALEKYVEALRLNPDDIETLINTGMICVAVDKIDDARHFFKRVLEIDPHNNEARQLLDPMGPKGGLPQGSFDSGECLGNAQSLAAQGDIDGAVSNIERLLAHDPHNAMAYNDLGVLYYRSGQKDKAVECYEKAVELAPDHIIYQKNLADYYLFEQCRIEDAMQLYVKVLQKDPQDVESILASGLVCVKMNNYPDARGFYQRALDIEPWNTDARQALSQLDHTDHEFIHNREAISNDALGVG